jgi:YVTN family beta-propeller protein
MPPSISTTVNIIRLSNSELPPVYFRFLKSFYLVLFCFWSYHATAQTITPGVVSGTIYTCVNTPSVNPSLQNFTVAGSTLTNPIVVTAPAGFEISLSPTSGFGSTISLTPLSGTVSAKSIYVRAASVSTAGVISGNVTLTSTGATGKNISVQGTIVDLPIGNVISDQLVTAGESTADVMFTATSGTHVFSWTNDTPGIGLSASGSGNIPSFTTANTGSTSIVASIKATPVSTAFAYIPNGSNQVAVVNLSTNTFVSYIPVGINPYGVAMTPDAKEVYIANDGSDDVSVISTSSNTVIATIPVGSGPGGIVISPDGGKVYVANQNSNTISVISTGTHAVVNTIAVSTFPTGLAVNNDGSRVYVSAGSNIAVVNTATNSQVAAIPIGSAFSTPGGLAVSPDGTRVYAAISGPSDNAIAVIDATSNTLITKVSVGKNPFGIVVSPDGTKVYVTNTDSNTVSVISTFANTVSSSISTATFPYGVSINQDGSRLYVVNKGSGSVSVFNAKSNSFITSVSVGSLPVSLGNFVSAGSGCVGSAVTFKITVKPFPPALVVSEISGAVSACVGQVSNDKLQVTVSGSHLIAPVEIAAPVGFEVSSSENGSYAATLSLSPTGGSLVATVIYVRPISGASVGIISGDLQITSTDATTKQVKVSATINDLPAINALSDYVFSNGVATPIISFSGDANFFTWTNDNTSIGLSNGEGARIPSFTTINNGDDPTIGTVQVTPSSIGFAYIPDLSGNVSVINTTTNQVVASILIGNSPRDIAISHDGTRVYVAGENSGGVTIIDTRINKVISNIFGAGSAGIVVSPDDKYVYSCNNGSNTVSVIDAISLSIVTSITVGLSPTGIAVTPDGKYIYAANSQSGTVSVIRVSDFTIVKTVIVQSRPQSVIVSYSGDYVYVANEWSGSVSVIDTKTNLVTATITNVGFADGLAINADGSRLYVSNRSGNCVYVINTTDFQKIATIPAQYPGGISLSADGKTLMAIGKANGVVSVMSTMTNSLVTTIQVPDLSVSRGNFITKGTGCSGTPESFTITVKPITLSVTNTTGAIISCDASGTAQFDISGNKLLSAVTVTAPSDFQISDTGNNFQQTLTLNPVSGSVVATIFVKMASGAATGYHKGDVSIAATDVTTQYFSVYGTVSSRPTINAVSDKTFIGGTQTSAITFSSSDGAGTYAWTNDNTAIGLDENGTGNIPAFYPANGGNTPIMANVSAAPVANGYAYIATATYNYVWVYNTTTGVDVTKIKVGSYPYGVSVTPDGSRVYVTNLFSSNVSVINTSTNMVIKTIDVSPYPKGIVVSPDGKHVYVGCQTAISVIDVLTNTVTTISSLDSVEGITMSPDGTELYAIAGKLLLIIDTNSNTIVAGIGLKGGSGICVTPDGKQIYVSGGAFEGFISVIDISTRTIIKNINVGRSPLGLVATPDGRYVYVAVQDDNLIAVIDAKTNTVTTTVLTTMPGPKWISTNGSGDKVYITVSDYYVDVLHTETNKIEITERFIVDTNPISMGNFVTSNSGCAGTPTTFKITVNPGPNINVTNATGNISACKGTASANPLIQQVVVSGTNLTANITATAPTNFEISLSADSGYGNTVVLNQASGQVTNTTIYVRSASSAAVGSINGNITLKSTAAQDKTVSVSGTINALPGMVGTNTPNGKVGVAYSYQITGVPSGYTCSATGLPAGLSISSSGKISGTPLAATSSLATIAVTASGACSKTANYFINVTKGTATVTITNKTQTYDGAAKPVTIDTTPTNLPVSVTYNGQATVPSNAGTYTVVATIVSDDYTGSATATLTINKTAVTITLSNTSQTYDGTSKSVTVTTTPANISTGVTYNGLATLPVNAASYNVAASITDPNYTGSTTGTLIINKATATISISNTTQTYDGTTKSITAITNPAGLTVVINYSATPIDAGVYTFTITINESNYMGSAGGTITIVPANVIISISNTTQTYSGVKKGVGITTIPSNVAVNTTYDGNQSQPTDAGQYVVSVESNNTNYTGNANATLIIKKAPIILTAADQTRNYGEENVLSISYDGFLNGESATVLDELPSLMTTATSDSHPGSYPITVVGGSDNNYDFTYVNGLLTIDKAVQSIDFQIIGEHLSKDLPFSLVATASSGLPVSFEVVSGPITISEDMVTITDHGDATIMATQEGNDDYASASSEQTFFIKLVSAIVDVVNASDVVVFPNPAAHDATVILPSRFSAAKLKLLDATGRTVYQELCGNKTRLELSQLPKGLYVLSILLDGHEIIKRIVIR